MNGDSGRIFNRHPAFGVLSWKAGRIKIECATKGLLPHQARNLAAVLNETADRLDGDA